MNNKTPVLNAITRADRPDQMIEIIKTTAETLNNDIELVLNELANEILSLNEISATHLKIAMLCAKIAFDFIEIDSMGFELCDGVQDGNE